MWILEIEIRWHIIHIVVNDSNRESNMHKRNEWQKQMRTPKRRRRRSNVTRQKYTKEEGSIESTNYRKDDRRKKRRQEAGHFLKEKRPRKKSVIRSASCLAGKRNGKRKGRDMCGRHMSAGLKGKSRSFVREESEYRIAGQWIVPRGCVICMYMKTKKK